MLCMGRIGENEPRELNEFAEVVELKSEKLNVHNLINSEPDDRFCLKYLYMRTTITLLNLLVEFFFFPFLAV